MVTAPRTLGRITGRDSESLPAGVVNFPWHVAGGLVVAYLLSCFGWHWAYMLPVFWVLVHSDERRQQRIWAGLQHQAMADAATSHGAETVGWLNELLRAVWPMYEAGIGRWAQGKLQPYFDESIPSGLGIHTLRIKSFSFGSIEPRRSDGRHRTAPFIFDRVQMISKSVPDAKTIRWVLMADVRWRAGSAQPLMLLDLEIGPKFLSSLYSVPVDAEVSNVTGSGTLRIELDFSPPYPYLCMVRMSFVHSPSIDFKLSVAGSPDVMDLAPPLRKHLRKMIDDLVAESMMGVNPLEIPLYEWYGEHAYDSTIAAAANAALIALSANAAATLPERESEADQLSRRRPVQPVAPTMPSARTGRDMRQGASSSLSNAGHVVPSIAGAGDDFGVGQRHLGPHRALSSSAGGSESSTGYGQAGKIVPDAASTAARAAADGTASLSNRLGDALAQHHQQGHPGGGALGDGAHVRQRTATPSSRSGAETASVREGGALTRSHPASPKQSRPRKAASAESIGASMAFAAGAHSIGSEGQNTCSGSLDTSDPQSMLALDAMVDKSSPELGVSCCNHSSSTSHRHQDAITSDELFGQGSLQQPHDKDGTESPLYTWAKGGVGGAGGGRETSGRVENQCHTASPLDSDVSSERAQEEAYAYGHGPPSPLMLTSDPPHRRGTATVEARRNRGGGGGPDGHSTPDFMDTALGQFVSKAAQVVGNGAFPRQMRDAASESLSQLGSSKGSSDEVGAVGELTVELVRATGLVTQTQSRLANLAPLLVFSLAVGDGDELRGDPIRASAATLRTERFAETTQLNLQQRLLLAVHDSLTQRLRVRVLIKEPLIAKDLSVLASTELPLADLRLNTTASKSAPLSFGGRRDPALLQLNLTYRLRDIGAKQ